MNTTKKLSILQIILSVLCGCVLAVYRASSKATGTGFLILAAISLLLCVAFAFGVDLFRFNNRLRPAEQDPVSFGMTACGGFLLIAAGMMFFFQAEGSMLLRVVGAVLCFFAGSAAVMRLKERDGNEKSAVLATIPIFLLGFFLLMFYRSNGDNPRLESFGFEIAVFLSLIVGTYFSVSPRFSDKAVWLKLGITAFAVAVSAHELIFFLVKSKDVLAVRGMSVAALILLLGCTVLLIQAIYCPPGKYPEPEPAEDKTETNEESDS